MAWELRLVERRGGGQAEAYIDMALSEEDGINQSSRPR